MIINSYITILFIFVYKLYFFINFELANKYDILQRMTLKKLMGLKKI